MQSSEGLSSEVSSFFKLPTINRHVVFLSLKYFLRLLIFGYKLGVYLRRNEMLFFSLPFQGILGELSLYKMNLYSEQEKSIVFFSMTVYMNFN